MKIRPFAATDRAAVIALWQACDLTRPWNDPDTDISFCISRPESTILVGEADDGRVVASVMCGPDGHRGGLYYLAADPARQKDRQSDGAGKRGSVSLSSGGGG